ncbi:hypothetical protein EYF80_027565 [Liparis tanakae]|uniref:Uncharacterized protein n=1 Tax=Liparis tanakae TaxID=230148 RepID=A0A4Z2HA87_9TELE|nr:hypothetical protein EYF80_027565 [Liparis tanakae]
MVRCQTAEDFFAAIEEYLVALEEGAGSTALVPFRPPASRDKAPLLSTLIRTRGPIRRATRVISLRFPRSAAHHTHLVTGFRFRQDRGGRARFSANAFSEK